MTDIPSTPASGPGRPKDPAKREAILDAAKRLFILHGYEGSSMDAIAAEAGVSKLTLYSHFASKENLFAAAVASKCQEQLPPLFFERTDEVPLEQVLLDHRLARFGHVDSALFVSFTDDVERPFSNRLNIHACKLAQAKTGSEKGHDDGEVSGAKKRVFLLAHDGDEVKGFI